MVSCIVCKDLVKSRHRCLVLSDLVKVKNWSLEPGHNQSLVQWIQDRGLCTAEVELGRSNFHMITS